jgi:hypothetical protein
MAMFKRSIDSGLQSHTGAPPPKWTPEMEESPAKLAADPAEEWKHYLPIEDDEMPA